MPVTPVQAVLYSGVGIAIGAVVWAVAFAKTRRAVFAALGIGVAALVVAGVVVLASMGAFCQPPPGAACA